MIAMAVVIFGFWNVPGVRNFINPLKLFTIGWHELSHIIMVRRCVYRYACLLNVEHPGNFDGRKDIASDY